MEQIVLNCELNRIYINSVPCVSGINSRMANVFDNEWCYLVKALDPIINLNFWLENLSSG